MTIDRVVLDETVPGWLPEEDFRYFTWFLDDQQARGVSGDLVELGVYLGKSAIVVGDHLRPGETFTVVDLFGAPAGDEHNDTENAESYATLTQEKFEQNYLSFHRELPIVHSGPSSEIRSLVADGTARFVHVDASHLYEHAAVDVDSARALLIDGGIVALDDYRSPHTPGVAAAVWEAVVNHELHPLLLTPQKMYATWSDPAPFLERLRASLDRPHDIQRIKADDVIRIRPKPRQPTTRDRVTRSVKAAVPAPLKPMLKSVRRRVRSR